MEKTKTAALGLVVGLLNGLFGSGGGTIAVPGMKRLLGVETRKAHASAIAVILPLTLLSVLIYMNKFDIDYKAALYVSAGGVAGGFVGARLLNRLSSKTLKRLFGAFMTAAAIRMIL